MMIAKYFDPDFSIAMDEWSQITAFDKATWASAGLLWFKAQGYDVVHISLFDYPRFIEKGSDYLIELAGPEVAQWQIAHSNVPAEQMRAQDLIDAGIVEQREPTMIDIKRYLDNGYLLRPLVNARKLTGKAGYIGHAVVAYGYDDYGVHLHDPGLPPAANRYVSWADFEAAWADPSTESKELDAIRKIQTTR